MKGQLIGEGNTAEVFSWGEKEILKLFRQEFFVEGIEKEYRISKEVEKLGLPVPKVGEMIELEGRKGITYERISGVSMLKQIMEKPLAAGRCARHLADIHYQIHQYKVEGFPIYKEALEWNIRRLETLTENQKQKILAQLKQLPDGDTLCHGDFHPGNIITNEKQSVILDWMTATTGNPSADVARTMLLLKDAVLPEGTPRLMGYIITIMRNRLAKGYLKRYMQLSGMHLKDIKQWRIPILAARLMEWVPEEEKKFILKEIVKAIG